MGNCLGYTKERDKIDEEELFREMLEELRERRVREKSIFSIIINYY